MELQGTIEKIFDVEQISDTFIKRNLVLTTNEAYPQKILIEFTQEKTGLLDAFQVGANIKVGINIRGREWTNPQGEVKYFNSINGWRIEPLQAQQPQMNNMQQQQPASQPQNGGNTPEDEVDDLPF